jgi:hypothetical protein
MKPKVKLYKVSREELDSLLIPPSSNTVIVRIPYLNKDQTTESGILMVADEDYKPALHAERWGVVYKNCGELYYDDSDINSMMWKTENEIQEGDEVWFDFSKGLHADTYAVDGEWYKVLKYQHLHVAKRGDQVIPLNGYVLFKEVEENKDSDLLISTNIDTRFGVVVHAGSYNQEYANSVYTDDIKVDDGDHVLFEAGTQCFPLEAGLHNAFSKDKLVLQQRKRVVAVVSKDHKQTGKLHTKVIGVRVKEREKLTASEIMLIKDNYNYRVGVVEDSVHPYIPEGTVVVLPKKKGTIFNDLEYYTEDRILYYETSSILSHSATE